MYGKQTVGGGKYPITSFTSLTGVSESLPMRAVGRLHSPKKMYNLRLSRHKEGIPAGECCTRILR